MTHGKNSLALIGILLRLGPTKGPLQKSWPVCWRRQGRSSLGLTPLPSTLSVSRAPLPVARSTRELEPKQSCKPLFRGEYACMFLTVALG